MRRSIAGVIILAWRPGIADLLGLERLGEGGGRQAQSGERGALAPVGSIFGGAHDRQRARRRR
jgi:hypothetical protein